MLPDKELPEVEQSFADRLELGNGSEEQIASLISRYATASIESRVSGYFDPRIGKLACAIQTPFARLFSPGQSDGRCSAPAKSYGGPRERILCL